MKLSKLLFVLTAFCVSSVQAENLSIATGGTGGVYYPMGGGLAAVLSKYIPNMSATAEVTGGSVDNLNLIGTGKPYVGFSMADAAKEAQMGEGKFVNKKVDLRTLLEQSASATTKSRVLNECINTLHKSYKLEISSGYENHPTLYYV